MLALYVPGKLMAVPPLFRMKSTVDWLLEPSRSLATTLAPWWAKRMAAALPMPCPAPVMMATCKVARQGSDISAATVFKQLHLT